MKTLQKIHMRIYYITRIKADLYRGTVEKYIDVEVGENETLDLTIDLSDATPVVPTQ